ncbi:MAG: tandem-95 repeat protein [Anaerolineae bacterium]|nr:tandem-95 repeat protein [Anaerolineae bacterium]
MITKRILFLHLVILTSLFNLAVFKVEAASLFNYSDHPGQRRGQVNQTPAALMPHAANISPTISSLPDQITDEDISLGPLAFTVADVETAPADLLVSAISSDPTLIPNENILLGGSGTDRTVTLTPALDQSGTATVTLTVEDGQDVTSNNFIVTVNAVNASPTISDFINQEIEENGVLGPLTFTVSDIETAADDLVVSGDSSDTLLVPNENIGLAGTGLTRTVTIAPALNQTGSTTITLRVDDGEATASTSFLLTVSPFNNPPTISNLSDQVANEDTTLGPLAFSIDDVETAADDLVVSSSSSNLVLVPEENIVFGGSGTDRTVTVTPTANQFGTTVLTLTVDDGRKTTTRQFSITLNPVNDAPTISSFTDQIADDGEAVGPLSFTIDDVETAANDLTVWGRSSNPDLVPNENIILGGSGRNQTVTITPLPGVVDSALITMRVSDGQITVVTSFLLTVDAINDPPIINAIPDQTVAEDGTLGPITFTVTDTETLAEELFVSSISSNPILVPDENVVIGGEDITRTVTIIPTPDQFGTAVITLTVDDGALTDTTSFTVTVQPVNDAPWVDYIFDQETELNTPLGPVSFFVDDVDTPVDDLVIWGRSSNTVLVPNSNVQLGGSGTNRTVTITPATDQFGSTIITISADDGEILATSSFWVTVNPGNQTPTITSIPDEQVDENTQIGPLDFTIDDMETSADLLDLSVVSSNPTLMPEANISLGGFGASRTITLIPALNQNGTATITLTVDDGAAAASTSFVVTINEVNYAPTISNILDQQVDEDSQIGPLVFTISDAETPVDELLLTVSSSNPGLIPDFNVIVGGSGTTRTLTINPLANQSGVTTITLTLDDGEEVTTYNIKATVDAVNDLPTLSAISDQMIDEDGATGALPFTISDVDTPVDALLVSATSSDQTVVPNGNILVAGTGMTRTITITPAADQSGSVTLLVSVDDGKDTATSSFILNITGYNDLPTITPLADQEVDEDSPIGPLAFTVADSETAAADLVVSAISTDAALFPPGNISLGGSGANRTLSLTPATNQSGVATITLTVDDGLTTVSTNFVITVNAIADAPILSSIPDQQGDEDSTIGPLPFSMNDVETPTVDLTLTISSSNVVLIPTGNITVTGSGANRTLTLQPAVNQSGVATITLTVHDGQLAKSSSFSVAVDPVNDVPTLTDIADQSIDEDTTTGPLSFTIDDIETLPGLLSVSATSSNETLVPQSNIMLAGSGVNRTIEVTPAPGQNGVAVIEIRVSDGEDTTLTSFILTVSSVNDVPTISPISDQVIDEDSAIGPLSFTIGDEETASGALFVTASSSNPTLLPDRIISLGGSGANRTVTLIPAANQNGVTSITLVVSDGEDTASTTFTITVNALNDSPTISSIGNQETTYETPLGPLSFTIGDVETPPASLLLNAVSSNSTLLPNGNITLGGSGTNRTVTFTPTAGQNGVTTVRLTVGDGQATTSISFTLTVHPINYRPTISDIANQVTNEDTPTNPLSFTIDDVETPASSLILSGSSSNTLIVPDDNILFLGNGTNRTVTVVPAPNQFGNVAITITVSDGQLESSDTFLLTINPVNDPPVIANITDKSTAEGTSIGPIPFTISDIESTPSNLLLSGRSSNTSLVPNSSIVFGGSGGDRTVMITPVANKNGNTIITIEVSDGSSISSDTFNLTVNPHGADTDGDGLPDGWEIDHALDPLDPGGANGAQGDPDGDNLTNQAEYQAGTDPRDSDSDNDGMPDGWEITYGLNPLLGDASTDRDNDGLSNLAEFQYQTNPNLSDTDIDGMSDKWEIDHGLNPRVDDRTLDTDGDRINNLDEYLLRTNPVYPDSDNDSINDGVEVGPDPRTPRDTDRDGKIDALDIESDGDSIPDQLEGTADKDNDGLPNYRDDDSDGDGIPDSIEGAGLPDTDGDGTADYLDLESDGDGILDAVEGSGDIDLDGILNYRDSDSDGDGIPDGWEKSVDSDQDGIPDYWDRDSDNDGILDIQEGISDPDRDGLSNYVDLDSDGDGILDKIEGTGDLDRDGIRNYLDLDSDGDGLTDAQEGNGDQDADGIANYLDLDSDGDTVSDRDDGANDTDGDGIPNYLDSDSDGDNIFDRIEGTGDRDGDGVPNYLDSDSDGDTLLDKDEGTGDPDGDQTPNYLDKDSDGDNIFDSIERFGDLDGDNQPNYLDLDSDGDGLLDKDEGMGDPDSDQSPNYLDFDSDGDGIPDALEKAADPDGDGISNYLDLDSDGDTLLDKAEGTGDPDGDQTPNYLDKDSDGDTIFDSVEKAVDVDGDGRPNYVDLDSDGDTLLDKAEGTGDSDGDQTPNYLDLDSDGDTIPDSVEKAVDVDGDGQPNFLDLDSDGDGLLDKNEGLNDIDSDGQPDYLDNRVGLTITTLAPTVIRNPVTTTLTITGTGFLAPMQVNVGSYTLTNVTLVTSQTVRGILPSGIPAGIYNVNLTRADGDSQNKPYALTIGSLPPVEVTDIDKHEATNQIVTIITLTGRGFVPITQVKLDQITLENVTFVSAQKLQAVIPAGLLPATYDIKVINPDGQTDTLARAFTVKSPTQNVFLPIIIK